MVEVRRKEGETVGAMLRRFTRRVQLSGVLVATRKHHYYVGAPTKRALRARALRRIKKVKEIERLKKLGKLGDEDKKAR